MKQIGQIDFAFDQFVDGIYYYDIVIRVGDTTKRIKLPRYHVLVGWIEIFGLLPQHEWVILADVPAFSKSATLEVEDLSVAEHVQYTPDPTAATHHIVTTRETADEKEVCDWQQQYDTPATGLRNSCTFSHSQGDYEVRWLTEIATNCTTPYTLDQRESSFIQETIQAHGTPNIIIRKPFFGKGQTPPIYYTIFPISGLIDLANCHGSMLEIGYLHTDGEHPVDQTHGEWYKLLTVNDQTFCIVESNFSSREVTIDGKPEYIKDTYRKTLYQLPA